MTYYLNLLGENPQQIELEEGVFTVGSHDHHDIFCHLLKHGELEAIASKGIIYLQKANQLHVWINGHLITHFPHPLVAGDALTIGENDQDVSHFFFGDESTIAPDVPQVQLPKTTETKPHPFNVPPIHWKTVGQFTASLAIMSFLFFSVMNLYQAKFSSQEPTPISYQTTPVPPVNAYIQDIVGDKLLAIDETETEITVRILNGTPAENTRWANDLETYANHIDKDIFIIVVDPNTLVRQIKHDIQQLNTQWRISHDGLTITVTGACTTDCTTQHQRLQQLKYQDVTIVDKIHAVPIDFKIHSLTVSKNTAQATVSRNGQYTVVPENGQLYQIGTINLIRHNGIEVTTPYGNVFIPWNKS